MGRDESNEEERVSGSWYDPGCAKNCHVVTFSKAREGGMTPCHETRRGCVVCVARSSQQRGEDGSDLGQNPRKNGKVQESVVTGKKMVRVKKKVLKSKPRSLQYLSLPLKW